MPRLMNDDTWLPLLIMILLAAWALKTRLIEYTLLFWIGAVLFCGGAVATLGGHISGYFDGFYFWGMVVIGVAICRLVWFGFRKMLRDISFAATIAALIFFLGGSILLLAFSFKHFRLERLAPPATPIGFLFLGAGGYLDKGFLDYIEAARQSKATGVFEEYWGLWSRGPKVISSNARRFRHSCPGRHPSRCCCGFAGCGYRHHHSIRTL